jgi:hypothetical protein
MEYGVAADDVCLVVDRVLSVRRHKVLDSFGVAVLVKSGPISSRQRPRVTLDRRADRAGRIGKRIVGATRHYNGR